MKMSDPLQTLRNFKFQWKKKTSIKANSVKK